MPITDQLAQVVGAENVLDDPKVIEAYTKDHSLTPRGLFTGVVRPKTAEEVQKIIQLANEKKFPVIPSSSGIHFHGGAIPRLGGVVLDMSRMNAIREIDEVNRVTHLEVGVNWEQLQNELETRGYRSIIPLLPHASRSVITDWLEREQPVVHVTEYADALYSMQVIWGSGEEFVTGSASINHFRKELCAADGVNPSGPGPVDYYRFLEGAQGTMGVVTWGIAKFEEIPSLTKTFFMPVNNVEDAIIPIYKVLRRRIGYECVLLNSTNLAAILTEDWPDQFNELRSAFAPWTIVLVIGGLKRRPEEKVAYEEKALREIRMAHFPNILLTNSLPGMSGIDRKLPGILRKPWPKDKTYWKHAYKGGCQDLMFVTTLDRAPGFIAAMNEVAGQHQFLTGDIGCSVQPLENGRACQIEFNIYYDPETKAEVAKVRGLYAAAAARMLEKGAYFNRPYGIVAEMAYHRAADYAGILKRIKKILDPNNVMNPGNLCF
ncbi:MAG: FAD-binding oxidoreductase [Chloroflexota bacterium]